MLELVACGTFHKWIKEMDFLLYNLSVVVEIVRVEGGMYKGVQSMMLGGNI